MAHDDVAHPLWYVGERVPCALPQGGEAGANHWEPFFDQGHRVFASSLPPWEIGGREVNLYVIGVVLCHLFVRRRRSSVREEAVNVLR